MPLSGEAGHRRHPRHDRRRHRCRAPAARRATVDARGTSCDAYVKHVMSFIDVVGDQAVQRRARRRQRHGAAWSRRSCSTGCRARRRGCVSRSTARFPNHEANPLIEENRRDITERVIAEKADIGIAWDGDADRCFFIDGTGEFVSGDFITALLAEAFLLKHPGVDDHLRPARQPRRQGHGRAATAARALMNRVGHAFFKQRMRETNGIFGGEVTGHYYFRDNFYADNGFIPALLILELMSKKGQSLHELLAAAARRSTSSPARSTPS